MMADRTFTLSHVEATFVVAALWHQLNGKRAEYKESDREVLIAVMLRLTAALDLDDDVRRWIDQGPGDEAVNPER